MSDYGIKISADGSSVDKATLEELLMSTQYPFDKLDTTNPVSFQNIDLIFVNDPPEPTGGATEAFYDIHAFEHGYDYTPAFWVLFQLITPPSGAVFSQNYFLTSGVIGSKTAFDDVSLSSHADDEKIYIELRKYSDTGLGGQANNLVGTLVRIRPYVFVDSIDSGKINYETGRIRN